MSDKRSCNNCETDVDTVDSYFATHQSESMIPNLLSWQNMTDAAACLKTGKATSSFIKPEHVLCGSLELMYYLHLLFNALLTHSYVPHEFLLGTISPIVKDTCRLF